MKRSTFNTLIHALDIMESDYDSAPRGPGDSEGELDTYQKNTLKEIDKARNDLYKMMNKKKTKGES